MKRYVVILGSILLLAGLGLYIRQIIHETVESDQPGQRYMVSLGDSVGAGAGLSDANSRGSAGCDLSPEAFPLLLGSKLHEPVEQFACSGATVAPMAQSSSSLLDGQDAAAQPFLRGSDVVVYAGANDIGWLQLLLSCTQTNCATAANQAALAGKLQTLQASLGNLLAQLQHARPRRLVVNTYYDLFAPGDACLAGFGITPAEVSFIRSEEAQLNTTITTAAAGARVTTVPIDFGGHALCSTTSWIQGVSAKAPLHPTAAGQQHIAQQDAQALTVPSPP